MLSYPNGSRIDVNKKYPNKGIIRGSRKSKKCWFVDIWNMYKCEGLNYKMLVVESLDSDTETRRLSPIGLASEGYIDLINGPQDHGWCLGYTCSERISTFNTIVAMGYHYELHMTSYNPQKTRLRLLNANETDSMRIEIYYPKPQRLDIYRKGAFNLYQEILIFIVKCLP